jgi:hypothetical protein
MQTLAVDDIRDQILDRMLDVPARRLAYKLRATDENNAASDIVLRGPRIPEPIYQHLSPDQLIPGIARLPYDSATLLVENRKFIEAVLIGCNHEMNRELLWREFPGDLRTTVFARFWERGAAPENTTQDDIRAIHEWNGPLGSHRRNGTGEDIALVLRAELVRRYPTLMVTLNRQALQRGQWRPDAGTNYTPSFWATLAPDTIAFGFPLTETGIRRNIDEYFFIIYEPPGRYRFGLDINDYASRKTRRDLRSAPVEFPTLTMSGARPGYQVPARMGTAPTLPSGGPAIWDDLSWRHFTLSSSGYLPSEVEIHPTNGDAGQWGPQRSSATLASVLFQKPVRAVVPARRLLGDG